MGRSKKKQELVNNSTDNFETIKVNNEVTDEVTNEVTDEVTDKTIDEVKKPTFDDMSFEELLDYTDEHCLNKTNTEQPITTYKEDKEYELHTLYQYSIDELKKRIVHVTDFIKFISNKSIRKKYDSLTQETLTDIKKVYQGYLIGLEQQMIELENKLDNDLTKLNNTNNNNNNN